MKIQWDENDDFCGMRVGIRGTAEEWTISFTSHRISNFADINSVYGLTSVLDGMTIYFGDRKQLTDHLNAKEYIPLNRTERLWFYAMLTTQAKGEK